MVKVGHQLYGGRGGRRQAIRRKRYAGAEMKKTAARAAKSVFPLPHSFRVVNPDNYQEILLAKETDLFGAKNI